MFWSTILFFNLFRSAAGEQCRQVLRLACSTEVFSRQVQKMHKSELKQLYCPFQMWRNRLELCSLPEASAVGEGQVQVKLCENLL